MIKMLFEAVGPSVSEAQLEAQMPGGILAVCPGDYWDQAAMRAGWHLQTLETSAVQSVPPVETAGLDSAQKPLYFAEGRAPSRKMD